MIFFEDRIAQDVYQNNYVESDVGKKSDSEI